MTDNKRQQLLKKWRRQMRDSQRAHYITSTRYNRLNYAFGIPVVCFTVLVSSSIFVDLQKIDNLKIQIIVGAVSVTAAIMASMQTFLRFPERAEMHRATAIKFGSLKKEIEKFLAVYPVEESEVDKNIDSIKQKWDEIVSESPTVSSKLWRSIKGSDSSTPVKHNKENAHGKI